MIRRLKAGQTLCVDRRDAPELPELLDLVEKGLVITKLYENPEQQYSVAKFRWKGRRPFD